MNNTISVNIQKLHPNVKVPFYATEGSAGCDVCAFLPTDEMTFCSGETRIVPTGIKVSIPKGYEMQVRPRSGMSAKTKFRIANSPGTVDSDYRGEVGIIIENIGKDAAIIKNGERIAQLVFAPIYQAAFFVVDNLDETVRGEGGFGSTGNK